MIAEMTLEELRSLWVRGHGLHSADPSEATRAAGWLHAIGGADVYVSARARTGGADRTHLDEAIAADACRIVPGARGCTMLVPRAQAGLAIGLAVHLTRRKEARDREKMGVSEAEIATLSAQIAEALTDGPVTNQGLSKRLPDGSARSLGDAGKKTRRLFDPPHGRPRAREPRPGEPLTPRRSPRRRALPLAPRHHDLQLTTGRTPKPLGDVSRLLHRGRWGRRWLLGLRPERLSRGAGDVRRAQVHAARPPRDGGPAGGELAEGLAGACADLRHGAQVDPGGEPRGPRRFSPAHGQLTVGLRRPDPTGAPSHLIVLAKGSRISGPAVNIQPAVIIPN